ncbi:MAG TPA: oligosaccharide flippase family protein [Clostridiales bacterium]|nr:oligosaccharide flippase family protein [Clostridiales bacterium]
MASVKKNFIYNSVYHILLIIFPLITAPYISRVLGASGIGAFSYTHSVANYFSLFAILGMKNYGNRCVAMSRDNRANLSRTFWSLYFMQVITAGLAVIVYLVYVLLFEQKYELIALLHTIFVLASLFDISWFFFGLEQFKLTVTRGLSIRVLSLILIFVFVKTPDDLGIYTTINVVSTLMTQLAVWPFLKRHVDYVRVTKAEIISHIKPNIILFIPVIAVSLYRVMDKIMLGSMVSDIAQVGFYENTEKIINIPMGLITALGTVMLPRMSNLVVKGDEKSSRMYIESSMLFVMFMGSALTFGIAGIAPVFAPFFFGEEFDICGELITYISPTILFLGWANVIRTQYLVPNKKDASFIISVSLGAVTNLVINILLIPKMGALGAIIGTIAAEFAVALSQTLMVYKYLDIMLYLKNGWFFILFGAIMFTVVRALAAVSSSDVIVLTVQISTGAFIYLALSGAYLILNRKKSVMRLINIFQRKRL